VRRILVTVGVLALAVPASATAAEHRVATPYVTDLQAEGAWTVWFPLSPRGPALWRHGGHVVNSSAPAAPLGTDARGNVVALDTRCRAQNRCTVSERPAASRRGKRLLATRFAATGADEYRGTLAVVGPRAYLRKRGASKLTGVDSLPGSNVQVGNGFLLYRAERDGKYLVRLVDFRGRRPRARTLATDDQFDEDCKCTLTRTTITDMAVEGGYAYWIQSTVTSTDGNPVGASSHFDAVSDVFRRRLSDRAGRVEVFRTGRWGKELAVDSHRTLYTGVTRGVFQVDRPDWQPVPQALGAGSP
jgi:hypothetical protein